ncbi:MAG TPA: transglycosylase domain-containing protein [Cyclobacteriaceae bacterium]|nr:transglycosylase domain-containing protein [Cyclobacteriaceae bacterium]HRJ82567.1 transglycosylase domain-containing protein [Cyclobacteriaceae bacterium]
MSLRRLILYLEPYVKRLEKSVDDFAKENPRRFKWMKIAFFIILPFPLILFHILIAVWIETPSNFELRNIQNQVASEVYSADSVLLGRYFIQNRTEVKFEDIAPAVIEALIATEDVRFYEHSGIDYTSVGRVLIKSIIFQDESSGGGSTITQQLAKNLYPRKKYWFFSIVINKFREVRNARRLERFYSKKELLTLYLNTVPFPDNVFGIQEAANRFYSVTAKDLNLDQAATLIGTLKATHGYNPRLFPDRAWARRNVVFAQMVKNKVITPEMADSLKKLKLVLQYNRSTHHHGLAPYFREYLKSELLKWCEANEKPNGEPYNLYTDGLKIYTTIDSRLQQYAEQAVETQMKIIQRQFNDHWGNSKPWQGKEFVLNEAIKRSSRYQKLKQEGLDEEGILQAMDKSIPMRIFTWNGEQDVVMSPLDSIVHHLQFLNAGFVVMEPSTGQVKAWVGGIAHDFFQYDHVRTTTKRQVGSIFKPIVYAQALEQGADPCQLIPATQQTYIVDDTVEWRPRNSQNDYQVAYSMAGGLAYSVNTVAVKLIQQAGVTNTIVLARKMGITSVIPEVPSISLGVSSVSLLEMTTAYACLANEGVTSYPYLINSMVDLNGKVIQDFVPKESGQRVLSKATAQLTLSMLQGVVNEGTASRMRYKYNVYNDIGGKTGTTQSNADGWFMAITPAFVMGSWVGADDPRIRFRSTILGQGSNTALPIVAYFMQQVNKDKAFDSLARAKFSPLPDELRKRMDCDLYELDEDLVLDIKQMIIHRDSIVRFKEMVMRTDSLAADTIVIPQESFLEQLYNRKLRIEALRARQDSLRAIN